MSVEQVLKKCVSDIWQSYDDDQNDSLDKQKIRQFVVDILKEVGVDESKMTDKDFDEIFGEIDAKCKGVVDQEDLYNFIKKVSET